MWKIENITIPSLHLGWKRTQLATGSIHCQQMSCWPKMQQLLQFGHSTVPNQVRPYINADHIVDRTLNTEYWILDTEYWTLDTGYRDSGLMWLVNAELASLCQNPNRTTGFEVIIGHRSLESRCICSLWCQFPGDIWVQTASLCPPAWQGIWSRFQGHFSVQ